MIDFKDMDDLDGGNDRNVEIRKNAHVVNGGEAMFDCPGCGGSGYWRGSRRCFKCNGSGKVGKRVIAAAKGMATRKANWDLYLKENAHRVAFLHKASEWSEFAASMLGVINDERKWSERQVSAIDSMMDKAALREAERIEQRAKEKAEREANAPTVDLTAIDKLFATATDNAIKKPVFRADGITLSKAPMHGRNAGALYVTSNDGTYFGKLVSGKFHATREAPKDTHERLLAIAADPTAEAIKYARRTGKCGCCGRGLVDPVSILAAIGPICAEKWGLDFMRELAATEYAQMKAEEIAKIKE